ncbi:hypothetical protein [Bradyrhizobium cenepequi]|uniref:hypothetical protein n=1 Tax=Bradyrhizobium cenepequi TaxID=2821403 RepID=UPI001CE2CCD4|nr:hypothetical protein [Bradyrhizobium cenepequi]MCA6108089.1 hypothetical protein [Bradyrhizobium cenepequi]
MKKLGKALVIARIKHNEKAAAHAGIGSHKRPWDKKPRKADGGGVDKPPFDPSQPFQPVDTAPAAAAPASPAAGGKPAFDPSKPFTPVTQSEPSWTDAFTDIGPEIKKAASEAWQGVTAPSTTEPGTVGHLLETGKRVGSALALPGALVTGPARSLIGHPMAQAEHFIGTLINPKVAATQDQGEMYEQAKKDVDTAMSALASRSPGLIGPELPNITAPHAQALKTVIDVRRAPATPPPAPSPGSDYAQAAQRIAQASGQDIDVPMALATDSPLAQRLAEASKNVPLAGEAVPNAIDNMSGQLQKAAGNIASQYGEGEGPTVAGRIGQELQRQAQAETSEATEAAARGDAALQAQWQRNIDAADEAIATHEGNALERARNAVGNMNPQDMGQTLIARLRQGEQAARAEKERLYDIAGEHDAEINAGHASGLRSDIMRRLNEQGAILDDVSEGSLTPVSLRLMRMLDEVRSIPVPRRPGAPGAPETPIARDVSAAVQQREAAAAAGAPGGGTMEAHSVAVPGMDPVHVQPRVVEASDLLTSADDGYDASLQPRDRSRAASQQQVRDLARNLNPERLGRSAEADRGAPIVGPDGMVESGNGRVQAIRQAYRENGESADAYRRWLAGQGVDTTGMREPVLIRDRTTPMSEQQRRAFTVGANQSATLAMSAPERALADASAITPESLAGIKNPADIASPENRDFHRSFAQRLPKTEQGAFVDKQGRLSAEGATRLRNAILAKAYGDSPVLSRIAESTNDAIKSISNALTAAAPEMAALREGVAAGYVAPEMDITADLLDAVERTARLRARGGDLAEDLAQQDAFTQQSPLSQQLMKLFYDADGKRAASSAQISTALRHYAQEAGKVEAAPGLGLGLEPVKPADIVDISGKRAGTAETISPEALKPKAGAAAPEAPKVVGTVNIHGLERLRKRLNAFSQDAATPTDREAARQIVRAYEDWVNDAIDNHLMSGSPEALEAFRRARAANRDWRTRFGWNERDDGDKLINKVVTGEVTPQEFSNWLVGNTQVGAKGTSSRLLARVMEATGDHPEAAQAIRGGVWNRLTQNTAGVTGKNAAKVADDIHEFFDGSGRDLANRLFTPSQRQIALAYADTLRQGAAAREQLAEFGKITKPSAMKPEAGPMQQLADAVLGHGNKSDEALFATLDRYVRSGASGDVKTLGKVLAAIPEEERGNLTGAMIRRLGETTQKEGGFSLDAFVTQWNKYSDAAKRLLITDPVHRQALDDIAMIAQRNKTVGKKYGNTSGTSKMTGLVGLGAGLVTHPYITIATLIGGAIGARLLAAPATARAVANWSKAASVARLGMSPERAASLSRASGRLALIATKQGVPLSQAQLMAPFQRLVAPAAQKRDRQ